MKGIPVWRFKTSENVPAYYHDDGQDREEWLAVPAEPGQWFPEPQASRLVDVEDPGLRDVIGDVLDRERFDTDEHRVDAVIAALKEHANG